MATAKSNIIKLTNKLKRLNYNIEIYHTNDTSRAFVNKNGYYIYISSNDNRNDFLIRTAKDNNDFFGGTNSFIKITSSFEEAINRVNLKLKESINIKLDSKSVSRINYPMIRLTYDIGDFSEANIFKNKFDIATDKFIELNIPSLEIVPDPEAEEDTWNIGIVDIDLTKNNASLLKEFIDLVDSIQFD